ncbi:MAG: hypothetical protein ABR552_03770, partial [Actinomycetota bacterium]
YDDFTNPGGIGLSPRDALEKLYRDMTYEYDPEVIKALIRVLEKRAAIQAAITVRFRACARAASRATQAVYAAPCTSGRRSG